MRTYYLKQLSQTIKRFGLRTFLGNAWRKITRRNQANTFVAVSYDAISGKESSGSEPEEWRDYRVLSEKIKNLHIKSLEKLPLKMREMISVKESELSLQAKSLNFEDVKEPIVSIVIPVYNHIRFTLECLLSIQCYTKEIPYEIIVVDDGSTDLTQDIISNTKNITYLRNPENLGFVRSCNKGAEKARGKYILFLNNDVQVTEGWIEELVKTFEDFPDVGAVGPKIIYPNNRLQEAGAIVNRDCSTHLIGLLDDPELPRYNYIRDVDYCSGVCLIVEAKKFREIGGFDDNFAPSYCEDVDLCFRLRQQGFRILYNPGSMIIHHLSVTSNSIDKTYKLQLVTINQQRLSEKWQENIDELNRVCLIAFYLPQFHPIPENDEWWGKGFTEWENVAKALPNFIGHYQPHLPADLGFYDLRVVEVMEQQAELAKRYGIYGFCYYYYWFGGKRLLEMPLERMLKTNNPDIPFCLCWANENWTRRWDGREKDILIGQAYSDEDDRAVILDIIRYIRHPNYIRINGRPLLLIYRIGLFPNIKRTTEIWRDMCRREGVGEIYLTMAESFEHTYLKEHPSKYGFDASMEFPSHGADTPIEPPGKVLNPEFEGSVNDYREAVLKYIGRDIPGHVRFRTVMTSWDNTPRRQNNPCIYTYATPGAYQAWLESIIKQTREQNFGGERIIFINAWNGWAEGAHLEPDYRFGHGYLEATYNALESYLLKDDNRK